MFQKVVLSILFVSKLALANAGVEAANRVCNGLLLNADKDRCSAVVRDAHHFTEGAVRVCDATLLTADKIACLTAIKNRIYSAADVGECGSRLLTRDQISCFNSRGQNATAPAGNANVGLRRSLEAALDALEANNVDAAKRTLRRLIEIELQRESKK